MIARGAYVCPHTSYVRKGESDHRLAGPRAQCNEGNENLKSEEIFVELTSIERSLHTLVMFQSFLVSPCEEEHIQLSPRKKIRSHREHAVEGCYKDAEMCISKLTEMTKDVRAHDRKAPGHPPLRHAHLEHYIDN